MAKKRVGILFGGKSVEHEVSLQSARNVYEAVDQAKFEVVLIGIDKAGRWHVCDAALLGAAASPAAELAANAGGEALALVPGETERALVGAGSRRGLPKLDVVFPVLHGTYGEDGTVQGLLKLANVPFVGAGVLGSAVGMDKDVAKRLLRDAGIPVTRSVTLTERTAAQRDVRGTVGGARGAVFRQAGQLRLLRGREQGARRRGLGRGADRGAALRPQAARGGIHPGPRNRGGGARQRRSAGLGAGRDRAAARVLFLRGEVSRRERRAAAHPGRAAGRE